jgi:hypothetical protein
MVSDTRGIAIKSFAKYKAIILPDKYRLSHKILSVTSRCYSALLVRVQMIGLC